jgi:hypothetical protein
MAHPLGLLDFNLGESMKSFLDGILHRCIAETNTDIRLTLAKCLGEIGAIDPKYLGDDLNFQRGGTCLSNRWMFENGAPWKSKSVKVHCELQLVTRHFVAALKAAPTPTDQHKIAFAIQEGIVGMNNQTACKMFIIQTHINIFPFLVYLSAKNA